MNEIDEVTLKVSLGDEDEVALVLDASESAEDHRETIGSVALQTMLSLPASVKCSLFFLGNPAPYPSRELQGHLSRWFDENQHRVSLIGPVMCGHSAKRPPSAIAIIGSGRVFDLEDWVDPNSHSRLILMPVAEPLWANELRSTSIARSSEELVQLLYDPVVRLDIWASDMVPLEWSNDVYRLQLYDGQLHLVADVAEHFDVYLKCESPLGIPKFFWAERRSGARMQVPSSTVPADPPNGETVLLTEAETETFRQAVCQQSFVCPECGSLHAWNTLHCGNTREPKYRFRGCPLFPTLEQKKTRGLFICRLSGGKLHCEVSKRAVLRVSDSRVMAMVDGKPQLLDYDGRSATWKLVREAVGPYLALKDDAYVLNYR